MAACKKFQVWRLGVQFASWKAATRVMNTFWKAHALSIDAANCCFHFHCTKTQEIGRGNNTYSISACPVDRINDIIKTVTDPVTGSVILGFTNQHGSQHSLCLSLLCVQQLPCDMAITVDFHTFLSRVERT